MVVKPGDLLCFSGAHLHASVPDESGRARFSIETRTVNFDDLRDSYGAPNVDGEGAEKMVRWFCHIEDDRVLADTGAAR
ncbi:MAG: hypothetical protein BMS9Abin10_0744 [Gammaproteobacteria bacterium]|nr:MAG: hypothetical protein BMS9Abin10_0744 [Gammaproteobacteria bacterium]